MKKKRQSESANYSYGTAKTYSQETRVSGYSREQCGSGVHGSAFFPANIFPHQTADQVGTITMEWVLGISDESFSRRWIKRQPRWEDETLTVNSSHTFLQAMEQLCATAIDRRREKRHDSAVDKHLWKWTIQTWKQLQKGHQDLSIDESSDSDDEDSYGGIVAVFCPLEM
jgi:hypothetical protein